MKNIILKFILIFFIQSSLGQNVDFDQIKFKGLNFYSSKKEIIKKLGKPVKIYEPNYECGFLSNDEQGIIYYTLEYKKVKFTGNKKEKFVLEEINFKNDKKIFLRPSYFSIVENREEDSIIGTITKIVFKGNYSIFHVLYNGCIFHITCIEPNKHQVGKEIAFYFNRENVHYI